MGLGLAYDGIKECLANLYYETLQKKIEKGKKEESTLNRLFSSLLKSPRLWNCLKDGAGLGYDLLFDVITKCPANLYYETRGEKIGRGNKEESTVNRLFPSVPELPRLLNS